MPRLFIEGGTTSVDGRSLMIDYHQWTGMVADWTLEEVAERLKVTRRTANRWIEDGKLVAVKGRGLAASALLLAPIHRSAWKSLSDPAGFTPSHPLTLLASAANHNM
jgi:hypothetical protein